MRKKSRIGYKEEHRPDSNHVLIEAYYLRNSNIHPFPQITVSIASLGEKPVGSIIKLTLHPHFLLGTNANLFLLWTQACNRLAKKPSAG